MTEEFFTEGEFARRQKKKNLEPDKVLTEVAPTDNYHIVVIDKACSDWSHVARVQLAPGGSRQARACQSQLPPG